MPNPITRSGENKPNNERPNDSSGIHHDADSSDYARPDLEPQTEEERIRRKNPLGYSITEPTEEEIEEGEPARPSAGAAAP